MNTLSATTTEAGAPPRNTNSRTHGYQCDACNVTFASKKTLNYHRQKCPEPGALKLAFDPNLAQMVHEKLLAWEQASIEKQQLSPTNECPICDVHTRTPRSLVFHCLEVHPNVDCFPSKKKQNHRLFIDENQNEVVNLTVYDKIKCPLCFVGYDDNRIRGHLMTAHPHEKSIFCTSCATVLLDPKEMQIHLLEHTQGGNLHTCDVCQGIFVSAEAIGVHKRLHDFKRPFFCSVCQKPFQSKTAAVAHFYSHLKIDVLRETEKTHFEEDAGYLESEPHSDQVCVIATEDTQDFVNVWD